MATKVASTVDEVTARRRPVGLIAWDVERSAGGYTLFAPLTGGGNVYLIDIEGNEVHRWKMPVRPGRDAVILPNGNLGYNGNHPISLDTYAAWQVWHGGAFSEVTPKGDVVWEFEDPSHHHDAQWLPNGNLLYSSIEPLSDDFACRVPDGRTLRGPSGTLYGDVIKEVNRSGETVWEWHAREHLDPALFPLHPFFARFHWPMVNGLCQTRAGEVLMSLRMTSGVIAVDKKTNKVTWHLGRDVVAQQHTPVELSNGNILIFDNGNWRPGVPGPYTRVIEVERASKRVVWQYADDYRAAFFSPYMGGAHRLDNGNTFIAEPTFGRLFEVTPSNAVVWEYVIPYFAEFAEEAARQQRPGIQNSVFRAHRYSKSQIPWL